MRAKRFGLAMNNFLFVSTEWKCLRCEIDLRRNMEQSEIEKYKIWRQPY